MINSTTVSFTLEQIREYAPLSTTIAADGITTVFTATLSRPKLDSVRVDYTIAGTAYTVSSDENGNLADDNVTGSVTEDGSLALTFSTAPDAGDIVVNYDSWTNIADIYHAQVSKQWALSRIYYLYEKGTEELVQFEWLVGYNDLFVPLTDINGNDINYQLTNNSGGRIIIDARPSEVIRLSIAFKASYLSQLEDKGTLNIEIL